MKLTQIHNISRFIIFTLICFLYGMLLPQSAYASTCVLSGNRVVVNDNILVKPIVKVTLGTPSWPVPVVQCVSNDSDANNDNKKAEYIFSLPSSGSDSGGTVTATVLVTASGVGTSYDFSGATNATPLSIEFGLDVWVPSFDNSGNIIDNCQEYDRLIKQDTVINNNTNKDISRLNGKTNLCMETGYTRKDTTDYYPYDWTDNQPVSGNKKHRDPDAIIPGFKTSNGTYFILRSLTLTDITYFEHATNKWQAHFMYQKEVEQLNSSFIFDQTTSVHILENSKVNGKANISQNFLFGNNLSTIQTIRFGYNNKASTFNKMRITQFVNKNWKGCAIDLTGDQEVQTYENNPGTHCHSNKSDYFDMAQAMDTETGSPKQDYVVIHGYLDQAKSDISPYNNIALQFDNGSTDTKSLYYMFFGALPFATPAEAWNYDDNGATCNVNQKLHDQSESNSLQFVPNPDLAQGNWQLGDVRNSAFRTCFVKMADQALRNGYDGIFLDGGHLWTSKAISNNSNKRFVGGVKTTINYNMSWSTGRTLLLQELRDMIDGHAGATMGIVSPVYTDNFHLVDFIIKEGAMFETPLLGTGRNDAHTQKEFKLGSMFQFYKHSKGFKTYPDPISGAPLKYSGGIQAHIDTYRRYFTTQQIFACKGPNRMLVQYCFSRIDNITSKHDFFDPETRSNPKYAHIPENTGIYYENGDWYHNLDYPSIHYCEDATGKKIDCDQAGATDIDPYHHVDDPCLPSTTPCAVQSDHLPPKKRQTREAIQVVFDAFKLLQSPTPKTPTQESDPVYITKFGDTPEDDPDYDIGNDINATNHEKIVTMSSMSSIRFDEDDCYPRNPQGMFDVGGTLYGANCIKDANGQPADTNGRLRIKLSKLVPIYNETINYVYPDLRSSINMVENNTYIFADQEPINGWKWARHGFAWKSNSEYIKGSFDFSGVDIFSSPISSNSNGGLLTLVRVSLKDIKPSGENNFFLKKPEILTGDSVGIVKGVRIIYLGSTETSIENRGNGSCIGSDNGILTDVFISADKQNYFSLYNNSFQINLRCEGNYSIQVIIR